MGFPPDYSAYTLREATLKPYNRPLPGHPKIAITALILNNTAAESADKSPYPLRDYHAQ
jgi:hypothetical protein